MENYTFKLNEANIEQELRCVICLTLPSEPLQCQGCDSIMCKECSKSMGSPLICPLRCKNPNYGKVKPKTMLLFDYLEIRCEKCFQSFKCLEFAKHERRCGRSSSIYYAPMIEENEIQEQPPLIKDQAKCERKSSIFLPFADLEVQEELRRALPFNASNLPKARTPKPKMKKKLKADPMPLNIPLVDDNHAIRVNEINQMNQPDQTVQIDKRSCPWYFGVTLIGFISLAVMWTAGFFGIKWLFFDSNLTFKWICVGSNLFEDNHDLCFFAVGQFSIGIIAIGQLAVGFITIAQLGIGLLFGVGLGIFGLGVTIGFLAVSFYVYVAFFGVAFYRAKYALGGLHSFYSLKTSKSCCVICVNIHSFSS